MPERLLPKGYTLRSANFQDAPAINTLIRAYETHMEGEAHHSEIELLQEWQRPEFHLDSDAWVVLSPPPSANEEPIIVGYQEIWNRFGHAVLSGDGYVHPQYNNLGIGTTMLRLLEERARQHIPFALPQWRVALRNGVDGLDPVASELHVNEGYIAIRYFWHMEIKLKSLPSAAEWPAGINQQPYNPNADVKPVFDAFEEAFRDHWGYTPWDFELWQRRMLSDESFDPTLWFLAIDGNEIAGGTICRTLDNRVGWISQLAVRSAWRRKGLGRALLQTAFQTFFQRNIQVIRLSVDAENPTGATRLYEKAGMHVAHRFILYEKELRPGVEPDIPGD